MNSEEKRNSEKAEHPEPKLDLYVIARIITELKERGGVKRTNLATYTGLAYDKLAKYIAWLNDKGLVSSSDEGIVNLTAEGAKTYDELVDWIMRYIGKVRFPKIS
ncbi:MAG: winged helix-turn-helix domain-containing protein [Nitrososphaerales archaeon]